MSATQTLKQVLNVNINQANSAHKIITEISNITVEVNDIEKLVLLTEMGKAVTTRDNAVRALKRNLVNIGSRNTAKLKDILNPEVYEMLKG